MKTIDQLNAELKCTSIKNEDQIPDAMKQLYCQQYTASTVEELDEINNDLNLLDEFLHQYDVDYSLSIEESIEQFTKGEFPKEYHCSSEFDDELPF